MIRIGTAGWGIPKSSREHFPTDGSALERYASVFNCVEINSTFYRSHRTSTYERWARSVPDGFAFSIKVPKEITHTRKLVDCEAPLRNFFDETAALGVKREVILVQLPPSLAYDAKVSRDFFATLQSMYPGGVAFEPRHPSWFAEEVNLWIASLGIGRVAADPAPIPEAATPGGSDALAYFRLHGSPRMYYSSYEPKAIDGVAAALRTGSRSWCIFDNTAGGAAAGDAIALLQRLATNV